MPGNISHITLIVGVAIAVFICESLNGGVVSSGVVERVCDRTLQVLLLWNQR